MQVSSSDFSATTPQGEPPLALGSLVAATAPPPSPAGSTMPVEPPVAVYENRLIEARLGMAGSLLAALRHKYSPAAAHSLRVALDCSSWAFAIGLPSMDRDELEVAALLHDIGKIGAPDRLLLKPGALDADESQLMDQYRLGGLDILSACCSSPAIVEIVRCSAGRYDGSRPNYPLSGKDIPPGARMLAIVDAFDSMTSEQVFRHAMSRERALHELFEHAGTQFDPDLVKSFAELRIGGQLNRKVISHWLRSLDPEQSNRFWQHANGKSPDDPTLQLEPLFQQKLLDNMYDAVVFVDAQRRIIRWNRGAERLTGIAGISVLERNWSPCLLRMRDDQQNELPDTACPMAYSMTTGTQSLRRMTVLNRNEQPVAVDVHTVPVVGPDGTVHGAAMLLHDASDEATLEEQCNSLLERATKDPLTQVANRAEFDRLYPSFIKAHLERQLPCSLVICDIDHFKSINDTYGHPAGDEVLRSFGQLLRGACRAGDLVARYGGEEFVLLCADCTNAAAARRAEELRRMLSELPQPAIQNNVTTASFGVTEIQPGDTADSLLRRADRALLEAKNMGRNMVVQLGDGLGPASLVTAEAAAKTSQGDALIDKVLVTSVPLNIAVEKLRGFVLDHHVEILAIKADRIDMSIDSLRQQHIRRRSDRPVPFVMELNFAEQRVPIKNSEGRAVGKSLRTRVRVVVRLKRARDRRLSAVTEQASLILKAIQAYLMATIESGPSEPGTTRRAVNMLAPWVKMRS